VNSDGAARRVTRAAETLHRAFYPGDEVRGPREGVRPEAVEAVDGILRLLADAEDVLAPGVGPADVTEGERLVREALDLLERFLPVWMLDGDDDLIRARADVERELLAVAAEKLQPAE
jgi:hypothetical protein